ncbi:ABC transporter, fused permease protein Plim_0100 [hydrothermal vent metagenome]|uniref:ABC transporter, fused permease protein Plim_0100 n=1 Tax=hydrothermal vent metagenome TaxID=652676 RepID=A0A3B1DEX6_9ZZZZ
MTKKQLVFQNLFYDWRTSFALLLGIIAGTTVITGALVVGDSVRGSLRQMTYDRLGRVDFAMTGQRFFREELAKEMATRPGFKNRFDIAPALAMTGSLESQTRDSNEKNSNKKIRRANQINIYAVDNRFWEMASHAEVVCPVENEVILNAPVAKQLNVKTGDKITLWIAVPSSIPRDSLLGERDEMSRELELNVKTILPEDSRVGRFGLKPNQQLPFNAFVSLSTLQQTLEIDRRRNRKTRVITPAKVNALFLAATTKIENESAATSLQQPLDKLGFRLADLGLHIIENKKQGYLSLESDQMILDETSIQTAEQVAASLNLKTSAVMVYLANEIYKATDAKLPEKQRRKKTSFYSIVAGLKLQNKKPFGPFPMTHGSQQLAPNEIVINTELNKVLNAQVGDELVMKYHAVESHGNLPEKEERFKVTGIVSLNHSAANDRHLTPVIKGVTDANSFADWNQPFPMKLPVPKHDDDYWNNYRATPKSFITLAAAQQIWKSRYGQLTSFRIAPAEGETLAETKRKFQQQFLNQFPPEKQGMIFQPVKQIGLQAAAGTTDFSGLFFGFSFFIILSAVILIGLLFRLSVERRSRQIGLLQAVGFSVNAIRNLLFTEGLILVLVGATAGTFFAIGYAQLMIYGLKTWWYGAMGTRFLNLYVQPMSLGIGFVIAVIVAMGAIGWALRQFKYLSTRALLAGAIEPEQRDSKPNRWLIRFNGVSLILIALLAAMATWGIIPATEAFGGLSWRTVLFFLVGIISLTTSLTLLAHGLHSVRFSAVQGKGLMALLRLSIRNAARHRQRSLLTVGLIASATFVLVAVVAGHRNPAVEKPELSSGNGGFRFVAQADQPIFFNLNNKKEREKQNISSNNKIWQETSIMSFRVHRGENASCLNIYQTQLPTILGVPQKMIERSGFKFADTKSNSPWQLLNQQLDSGNIPVLGDMNTLMYSLHKGIDSQIDLPAEIAPTQKLQVAGMFDGSVFQGVLLMSEENFLKLFPNESGYRYFLIEANKENEQEIIETLETRLSPYGFDVELISHRLASFLAVQNTYLSTFQTLGGLGLLLGTFGLATVMLRNVFERRSELALLRAIGFQEREIALLVLLENGFLLSCGLLAGTVSALLAMLPHLTSTGADVPLLSGSLTLAGIFVLGMLAAFFAVIEAIRSPLLTALRSE